LFNAYWMADVVGPNYSILGLQIAGGCHEDLGAHATYERCLAGAAQSAISINNGANQLASMTTGARVFPFKTGCLPLHYSGNPGVHGYLTGVSTGNAWARHAAVMGGVWAERYGKRQVLVVGFLGILW